MPEQHKGASNIRRRNAQVRLRRRRHVLEGVYDEDGDVITDIGKAGEAIARHWQPVFAESVASDVDKNEFLDYVLIPPMHECRWTRGEWIGNIAGVADTTA